MQIPPSFEIFTYGASSVNAQYWFLAPIIMLALIGADTGLTYFNIRDLATRYGLPLAAALETNGTVRNSWLKHGIKRGETRVLLLFLPIYLLVLVFVAVLWIALPVAFGFIVGFYGFVVVRHVNLHRNLSSCHPCPQCQTIHRPSPFLPREGQRHYPDK